MGVQMGEKIPLKSNDLEKMFNEHIARYGYDKDTLKEDEKKVRIIRKPIVHP